MNGSERVCSHIKCVFKPYYIETNLVWKDYKSDRVLSQNTIAFLRFELDTIG